MANYMWNAMLNDFERHSLLNKLSARRNFYAVTMDNREHSHISQPHKAARANSRIHRRYYG